MESGRLKRPAWREFFPERDVVSEERRLSVENNPESKLYEQLLGTAFISHPYQIYWEWQSEENNLTRSDLQHFFDTYYAPGNITVALVGDVDLSEVRRLADEYFGDIPAGPPPPPIYTREEPQQGERRVNLHYAAAPVLYIGYHKTAFDDPDEPAFQVIRRLLAEGRSSRLYRALVLAQQLCLDVGAHEFPGNSFGDEFASLFIIEAYPKEGVTTAQVEEAVYEELNRLASEPISERELKKIKNRIEAEQIWGSYTNLGLARNLAFARALARDWTFLESFTDRIRAVTVDDVRRVAARYLVPTNRTVATLITRKEGGDR
jgi:predicted Zn-dependent peptidase